MSGYQINVTVNDGYAVAVTLSGTLAGAMALGDWAWAVSPVESPNGSLTRFTLPDGDEYASGKILAFRDTSVLTIGNGLTAVSGSQTVIDFDEAPDSDDTINLIYIKA